MEGATQRVLIDSLTDEFERVRKFVSLMGMPRTELRSYLLANYSTNQYSRDEVAALWSCSSSTTSINNTSVSNSTSGGPGGEAMPVSAISFDDVWIELGVAAQKQAYANQQQQFMHSHNYPPARRSSMTAAAAAAHTASSGSGVTQAFPSQSYGVPLQQY